MANTELVNACEKKDADEICNLTLRSAKATLKDTCNLLTDKQRSSVAKALSKHLDEAIERMNNIDDMNATKAGNKGESAVRSIAAIMREMTCTTSKSNATKPSDDEVKLAKNLHDNLCLWHLAPRQALNDTIAICESFWVRNLKHRERLLPRSMPHIIDSAVRGEGGKAAVKRAYRLRDGLSMLNLEAESGQSLRNLLLRCAFSPSVLRSNEGRKFIAFLLRLSKPISEDVFQVLLNQIPSGRQSILKPIGEVLIGAFKSTPSSSSSFPAAESNDQIESFISRVAELAVLASDSNTSASARRVLTSVNASKGVRGVDAMLLRVHEPVTLRALYASNPSCRRNALFAMSSAFPIHDPDEDISEVDRQINSQLTILHESCTDGSPQVRSAAAEACGIVLDGSFELISTNPTTQKILSSLSTKLAKDGNSSSIRSAAINALSRLCLNPLSQRIAKSTVTGSAGGEGIGELLNDPSSTVRSSLASFLLASQESSSFRFFDVVDLEQIHVSLALDSFAVSKKIARLLSPSYLPNGIDPDDGAARLLTLLDACPLAAERLCRFASNGDIRVDGKVISQIANALITRLAGGPTKDIDPGRGGKAGESQPQARKRGASGSDSLMSTKLWADAARAATLLVRASKGEGEHVDGIEEAKVHEVLARAPRCAKKEALELMAEACKANCESIPQSITDRCWNALQQKEEVDEEDEIATATEELAFSISDSKAKERIDTIIESIDRDESPTHRPEKRTRRSRSKASSDSESEDGESTAERMHSGTASTCAELLIGDERTRQSCIDNGRMHEMKRSMELNAKRKLDDGSNTQFKSAILSLLKSSMHLSIHQSGCSFLQNIGKAVSVAFSMTRRRCDVDADLLCGILALSSDAFLLSPGISTCGEVESGNGGTELSRKSEIPQGMKQVMAVTANALEHLGSNSSVGNQCARLLFILLNTAQQDKESDVDALLSCLFKCINKEEKAPKWMNKLIPLLLTSSNGNWIRAIAHAEDEEAVEMVTKGAIASCRIRASKEKLSQQCWSQLSNAVDDRSEKEVGCICKLIVELKPSSAPSTLMRSVEQRCHHSDLFASFHEETLHWLHSALGR